MIAAGDCLLPTVPERITRVVGDLRMGLPALLADADRRQLVAAVEALTPGRLEALCGRFGAPELVITGHRAASVLSRASRPPVETASLRIQPPRVAGLDWFKRIADPRFDGVGPPVGPLHRQRGEDGPADVLAIALAKRAELLPAVLSFYVPAGESFSGLSVAELSVGPGLHALADAPSPKAVAAAGLPLETHERSRLHVFRDRSGRTEHFAVEIGEPDPSAPVLTRLHSACFTGDVLGSLKCDCGPQLQAALQRMSEAGAGVLLYLNQEGRGIGLANKMRVYDLQAQGLDTVEANHRLGFADDERDFRVAAKMLRSLGFCTIRLLTNNPAKVSAFRANGITIAEHVPLRTARNVHNDRYLQVKALKSGHML